MPKQIAIGAMKGGVGKTMVAVQIATTLEMKLMYQ